MRRIETPLGPVVFQGRDTGRPVVVVLTAMFAPARQFEEMQHNVPGVDVWRAHLPGNHCPELETTSLGAFGFAYSHALRAMLAGRRAAIIGNSAGALVAMAIDQSLISRSLLVEPPLHPTLAWPLESFTSGVPAGGEEFVWQLFGIGPDRREPRDYRHLIDRISGPATVLVGADPLMPQRADLTVSLVDDETRRRLAEHPLVDLRVIDRVGHNVAHERKDVFWAAVWEMAAKLPDARR